MTKISWFEACVPFSIDGKDVYTIVLFEQSSPEFHAYPQTWLHYFQQRSDTGLELELLQKYLFIPLDIFRKNQHNKIVENKLNAWLTFFCMDDPDDVVRLIETYPEFRQMYHEAYEMCRNLEDVMGLFSEELRELDRNTVQLMIDDMQEELNRKREELAENGKELAEKERQLQRALKRIEELEASQK